MIASSLDCAVISSGERDMMLDNAGQHSKTGGAN